MISARRNHHPPRPRVLHLVPDPPGWALEDIERVFGDCWALAVLGSLCFLIRCENTCCILYNIYYWNFVFYWMQRNLACGITVHVFSANLCSFANTRKRFNILQKVYYFSRLSCIRRARGGVTPIWKSLNLKYRILLHQNDWIILHGIGNGPN